MEIFHLRMLIAARRQALRDCSDTMTQKQIDEILDQITMLTKLLEDLEDKRKR
jgi:hypothetical protein